MKTKSFIGSLSQRLIVAKFSLKVFMHIFKCFISGNCPEHTWRLFKMENNSSITVFGHAMGPGGLKTIKALPGEVWPTLVMREPMDFCSNHSHSNVNTVTFLWRVRTHMPAGTGSRLRCWRNLRAIATFSRLTLIEDNRGP